MICFVFNDLDPLNDCIILRMVLIDLGIFKK